MTGRPEGARTARSGGRPSWMARIGRSRRLARLGLTWRTIMTGSAWARRATPEIIGAGTQLRSVPLVPDIRLHQASDPISLWQRTELTSGRTGLDPPYLYRPMMQVV